MKIQIISHTVSGNVHKLFGRWSIIPYYLEKQGHQVDHVLKKDWTSFLTRYRTFKPEVIIAVGPIGALVGLLRKIRIIRVPLIHDWNDNYVELMSAKWGTWLVKLLEYLAIRCADKVISPSKYRYFKAQRWGKKANKSIFYLQHGVKEHFLHARGKADLPGKHKVNVLYVGEISRYKRTDQLIRALAGQPCDLLLIGTSTLPKLPTAKNIYFLGQKPSKELPKYLRAADYLLVSEDNDSALKIQEYLALGKAVLVPTGKIEYRKGEYRGFLFYRSFNQIPKLVHKRLPKHYPTPKGVLTWDKTVSLYVRLLS